jgi:signal transduction histidine kinase
MRRFASDVLSARDIALRFSSPEHDQDVPIGADARREVFFVFKESVNNIARHADCSVADITLSMQRGWLVLQLRDDGKGFDPGQEFDGNGLVSMHDRARRLGGELTVLSHPGSGTTTMLRVPLPHQWPT